VVLDLRGGDRVVVLSPHLDDAVLSLGAAIATWTLAGAEVLVLTVMAGRPEATGPAGQWDTKSGYASEGEAARARREEDRSACAILGAAPVWLDYGDSQYGRGADDGQIWDAVLDGVGDAPTVLAPGFPLSHPDHEWLGLLAFARRDPAWRFGLYVEQPYAIGSGRPRDLRDRFGADLAFVGVPAPWRGRRRKRRALLAYRSQHAQLAEVVSGTWGDLQRRIDRVERHRGGEGIAWLV
jgi:LmbE family N-acetylglucosaminyl deacetylase